MAESIPIRSLHFITVLLLSVGFPTHSHRLDENQPLSKIDIYKATLALRKTASVKASPSVLGLKGEDTEWVTVHFRHPEPSADDWIAVFSPAKFDSSACPPSNKRVQTPLICSSPIKYKFANYSNPHYAKTGKASLKFQLINQRADFSFALFSGGLSNPKLIAVSHSISFKNPKAPLFPRLAHGKLWNEMHLHELLAGVILVSFILVSYKTCGQTLRTYERLKLLIRTIHKVLIMHIKDCHDGFTRYTYRLGHRLFNGSYIWSKRYSFKSSPHPGEESLQRVIIFGDMGKGQRDGSNEYSDYQPGALNTTDQLVKDLNNIDIVFHIGDLAYANGYLSEWDQFTAQVEPIASRVPYMVASGNHERDWPNTGSFYANMDSGGECGVPAETMFYYPAENRAKFWYATDYGLFRFCIADTEHDWREGSEQYRFIEQCLASADRQKQPWLIFAAHRVLGYSSNDWYASQGSYEEPMGRESLQRLWQKYRVDIAFYGHVHNYERTCPIYQNQCVNTERTHYSGTTNGTIHVVVGGAGSHLSPFTQAIPKWSLYRDFDFGFVKLTAFNRSSLLFQYKKSIDGKVYDHFTISRDYRDVLACVHDSCEHTTLAS